MPLLLGISETERKRESFLCYNDIFALLFATLLFSFATKVLKKDIKITLNDI